MTAYEWIIYSMSKAKVSDKITFHSIEKKRDTNGMDVTGRWGDARGRYVEARVVMSGYGRVRDMDVDKVGVYRPYLDTEGYYMKYLPFHNIYSVYYKFRGMLLPKVRWHQKEDEQMSWAEYSKQHKEKLVMWRVEMYYPLLLLIINSIEKQ